MAVNADDIFLVPRPDSFLSPPVENTPNSHFSFFGGTFQKVLYSGMETRVLRKRLRWAYTAHTFFFFLPTSLRVKVCSIKQRQVFCLHFNDESFRYESFSYVGRVSDGSNYPMLRHINSKGVWLAGSSLEAILKIYLSTDVVAVVATSLST